MTTYKQLVVEYNNANTEEEADALFEWICEHICYDVEQEYIAEYGNEPSSDFWDSYDYKSQAQDIIRNFSNLN